MINKSELFASRSSYPVRADRTGAAEKPQKPYEPDDTPDGYIGDLPETQRPEKDDDFKI